MDNQTQQFSFHRVLMWFVVASPVIYYLSRAFYNVFMHPLRHIPGPKINAISRIPYTRHHIDGSVASYLKQLHEKYGEVVRYSPHEVSFISSETAWTDIYGFRIGKLKGHSNTYKDPGWYNPPVNGVPSIVLANDADHTRGRRILAHAFSDRALTAQESLLQSYGDQLVGRLGDALSAAPNTPLNLVRWYNWTTFDVIADLTFGEPFGCLRDMKTHPSVELLLGGILSFRFFYLLHYFPFLKFFGNMFVDQKAMKERKDFAEWVFKQTDARLERDTDRADFMTYIMQHNNTTKGLSRPEIHTNAITFLGAGTETTATTLSGATYLLCSNPETYAKLKAEVRSCWANYEDITLNSVSRDAPYLLAVLQETLRYYPPVPTGFNRVIPDGGENVSGYFIPQGTSVTLSQHAAYHSPRNFTDPDAFVPERWMGDEKYANDKREWVQPFSYGPRACLGKNLAYAEMRLFLAKLVWSYDFELQEESSGWMRDQKVMFLWRKPELMVKLTPVQKA